MDFEEIIFWVFVIFIFFALYILKGTKKIPQKTQIILPTKIDFTITANNDYGVGSFLLDIATIGGHGRLKEAKHEYEKCYAAYASKFNLSIDHQRTLNNKLNMLGENTYKLMLELEKSQKLLNQPIRSNFNLHNLNNAQNQVMSLQKKVYSTADTGMILLQGSTIGGLAAVGSWTMVSLLGTASTGTAIASLSGVAAHNAILAWFGGGAIAAGGGGMAAGTLTLGAIVLVPIVVFSAYKTHSKANELEDKIKPLIQEIEKLKEHNFKLSEVIKAVDQHISFLNQQIGAIKNLNLKVNNIIYPNGVTSKVTRNVKGFLKQDFYSKHEAIALDELAAAIEDIYKILLQSGSQKLLN